MYNEADFIVSMNRILNGDITKHLSNYFHHISSIEIHPSTQ